MVSKEAFHTLCVKAKIRNLKPDMVRMTVDVAYRHITRSKWTHGKPTELYIQDGYPCIRYGDGTAFHYDMVKGTWF